MLEGLPCVQRLPCRRWFHALAAEIRHLLPGTSVTREAPCPSCTRLWVRRSGALRNGPRRSFSVNARCLSGGRGQKGYEKLSRTGQELQSKVVTFWGSPFSFICRPECTPNSFRRMRVILQFFRQRGREFPASLGHTRGARVPNTVLGLIEGATLNPKETNTESSSSKGSQKPNQPR